MVEGRGGWRLFSGHGTDEFKQVVAAVGSRLSRLEAPCRRCGVKRCGDVTGRNSAVVRAAPIGGKFGTGIERSHIQMTRQLGNSGRGTDGPAPPMSEHERRKSADASGSGNDASERRGPAGSEARRREVEL